MIYSIKKNLISLLLFLMMCFPIAGMGGVTAYADSGNVIISYEESSDNSAEGGVSVNQGMTTQAKTLFNEIADTVALAGAVVLSFGLGKLFLAFKDDNAGAKSEAIIMILAGILVISIKTIMGSVVNEVK